MYSGLIKHCSMLNEFCLGMLNIYHTDFIEIQYIDKKTLVA